MEDHYGPGVVCLWTSGAGADQAPLYSTEPGFGGRIGPVAVLGEILGEETVRVADAIIPTNHAPIQALQTVVSCPGKKNGPGPRFRDDLNYQFLDDDPVDIRLSALIIGHIAITGVSGEVFALINNRLKQASPYTDTMMITHCNGASGYLPNDDAYNEISYEVVVTHVKQGYAEHTICPRQSENSDYLFVTY